MGKVRSRKQDVRCQKGTIDDKKSEDLEIYKLSYELAMEIFRLTKKFPKEETYSLIDQMKRSSRSIPANIAEGWAKRKYGDVFLRHLNDALGSCEEMKVWLDFSLDCAYADNTTCDRLKKEYDRLGAMIFSLMNKWQKF